MNMRMLFSILAFIMVVFVMPIIVNMRMFVNNHFVNMVMLVLLIH